MLLASLFIRITVDVEKMPFAMILYSQKGLAPVNPTTLEMGLLAEVASPW